MKVKVDFTLKEILDDMERYRKEEEELLDMPEPPVVYIGDLDRRWKPIATSDGYVIYGARYHSGTGFYGESVLNLSGDYHRLENPPLDIIQNKFPDGAVVVKMNCSADPSHGTIYWAEKEE